MTDEINTNEVVGDAQAEVPAEPIEQAKLAQPESVLNPVEVAELPTAQMEGNEPLAEESVPASAGQAEVRPPADSGEAVAEPEAVSDHVSPAVEPSTAQIPPIEPLVSVSAKPLEAAPPTAIPTAPVVAQPSRNFINELLAKARIAIQGRKRKKLDRIMALFEKRASITNDEVEKFLHISDATATRYLNILEQEGKIKQSGKTGKFVSYTKI